MIKVTFETNEMTGSIIVKNKKKECLGVITYDDNWLCYVWSQEEIMQMSSGCLQQVTDKLKELDRANDRRLPKSLLKKK